MKRRGKDVSMELAMLRQKLLFIEEAFFKLLCEERLPREKAYGLGNIVADLANDVQEIYEALYGPERDIEVPESEHEPLAAPMANKKHH